jgi:hypothetical protein
MDLFETPGEPLVENGILKYPSEFDFTIVWIIGFLYFITRIRYF